MVKLIKQVENFWDDRPCNIRHSPKPIGTKEYFDEVEKRKYFVEPHIPKFTQFDRWKGKKVLEIGCGIGTDSVNFARHGASVTCVELSKASLDICKERFRIYGLRGQFYAGNAENLRSFLPIQKYNLIYSFGAIHHTPNPERVLEQIKHYCDNKTEVRLMFYAKWSFKVFLIILSYGYGAFWKAKKLIRKYSEAETDCPVTHYYSFSDVYRLMKDYEIIDIHKDHIFPYIIDKYINYEYKKVWYFRLMPKVLFSWVEKLFGWHILITAKVKDDK